MDRRSHDAKTDDFTDDAKWRRLFARREAGQGDS